MRCNGKLYCLLYACINCNKQAKYIFNVTLTPVSMFLNLCSSDIRVSAVRGTRSSTAASVLALLGSSIGIQACSLSRVSGSLVGLRSRRLSKKIFPTGQRSLECQGTWVLVPRVFRLLAKRDQYKANWPIKASYQSVCSAADCSAEGHIESAEQSRTAEQNKISKLTVKLQIISTKHDCRM